MRVIAHVYRARFYFLTANTSHATGDRAERSVAETGIRCVPVGTNNRRNLSYLNLEISNGYRYLPRWSRIMLTIISIIIKSNRQLEGNSTCVLLKMMLMLRQNVTFQQY